jgi:hypothetical protein
MRKKFLACLCLLTLSSVTQNAFASVGYAGNISNIHAMKNGKVLFTHSGARSGQPACATTQLTRWAFDANTPAGQAQLSVLMTAYVTGKTITVSGSNACTDWGDSESVDYFYIVN